MRTSLRSLLGFLSIAVAASIPAAVPVAWHGALDIATGHGVKGPWRQNESWYDYVDDPTVAIDDQGNVAVAWVVQSGKDIYFRRLRADDGNPRDAPVNVSRSPATFSWLPRIALAPHTPQHVYLLWQEIIFSGGSHGGDILFARSDDGGDTFAEPINLSNSVGGDGKGRINRDIWHNGSLDIAAGADGRLYAAWTEYHGPLWLSRSIDGGKTFSRPQRVTGDNARPARGPSLALGADRTVYLAWASGDDDAGDIRVATSTDGGESFSEPRIVAPSESYSDTPKLAVDPKGTLHLVYGESAGGPFERYHIRYTRSTDRARTFEPAREISNPAPAASEGAGFPSLSIDGNGNLHVLWELFREDRLRPYGLGFTVSNDGGRRFMPPILVPGSSDPGGGPNGSQQGLLTKKLAVNNGGSVAVVNSSLKENERSRVWLIRGRDGARDI